MEIVAGPALTVQIEDYRINKALLQIRTVRYVRYHSFFSFWLQANLKIRNDPVEDVPAHGTEQPPGISSVELDPSHLMTTRSNVDLLDNRFFVRF